MAKLKNYNVVLKQIVLLLTFQLVISCADKKYYVTRIEGKEIGITNKNGGNSIYDASNEFISGRYSSVVDTSGIDLVDMSAQSADMVIELGVDVGAAYNVGVVTTSLGWTAMRASGNTVSNSESLLWLYGSFESIGGGGTSNERRHNLNCSSPYLASVSFLSLPCSAP